MENVLEAGALAGPVQPRLWRGLLDDADAPKDYSTETSRAVETMQAEDCGSCMLRSFNEVPCRHLRQYRLYRTLPDEWAFNEDESRTLCADLTIKGGRTQ